MMDLAHEKRLADVENRAKSNTKRIDELKEKQDIIAELVSSVKVLADREKRVEDDVKEIKTSVNEIKEKPTKRFDGIIDKIIFTIVGGIVGYLLIKLGF